MKLELVQCNAMNPREISYYHYIEMTLGFIETYVYLTYVAKVLSRKMFFEFIEPMICLEVITTSGPASISQARSISPEQALSSGLLRQMKREHFKSFTSDLIHA